MRRLLIFLIVLLVHSISAQVSLTNSDVIEMVKSGVSTEIIAEKIRASDTKFDVSAAGLRQLSDSSVPDAVVVAMIDRDAKSREDKQKETAKIVEANESFPEQGKLSDLSGKTKVYI